MFQVLAIFQEDCLNPLPYLGLSFHELFLSQVFPERCLVMALRLCPLCSCSAFWYWCHLQWMGFLKVMCVPTVVSSKGCWLVRALLCHHLGQMFSPIWTVWGFGVQSPAARWSCRRHCPMGQPSSSPFSKPLVDGASQSSCNPAGFYSCCLFPPFFINSTWISSQAVMDFVRLRISTQRCLIVSFSSATEVLCHSGHMQFLA